MKCFQIEITGQVQGVGFRPHVYRVACALNLTGWVKNTGSGVLLEINGEAADLFVEKLQENLPPLAKISGMTVNNISTNQKPVPRYFEILKSDFTSATTIIGPDTSICDLCLKELFDPNSRFYHYPFLNCMNCGPRLTITKNLPYDRAQTSMHVFSMCAACQNDYSDIHNRRYHAQPTACVKCGPALSLEIENIAKRIHKGEIVAVKGLGGYQLICDANNESSIFALRQRKQREAKPFAMMCADINSIKNIVEVSDSEESHLSSEKRPIVLLRKLNTTALPDNIAPGLSHFGVMLPYTPLHYLLFDCLSQYQLDVLIVTSANSGGNPLLIDDALAIQELKTIADTVVSYNRDIVTRLDDSVLRVVNNNPMFIRRARGYVPMPIQLAHTIPSTLALGGYLKNTFCITRGDEAFVSQHLGDLKNKATIEFFHETLNHLMKFLNVKPERIAHDLHPDFYTTRLSFEFELPIFSIQHHHAHLASVMAEHCIDEPVLGLALDGYGYGENGEAWGGELCLLEGVHFQRIGYFQPLPLPGGDLASHEPWRMAVSVLHVLGKEKDIQKLYADQAGLKTVSEMLKKSLNCPLSSSCGRLFDAASALLGIQSVSHYEGHAAMRLESLVTTPQILSTGWLIEENRFNLLPTLEYLLHCTQPEGANIFHGTLIAGLAEWIVANARRMDVKKIVLSGGCFLNQILTEGLVQALTEKNLIPLLPQILPPNDGGLSLGQAWIAGRIN